MSGVVVNGVDLEARYGLRLTGDSEFGPPAPKSYLLDLPGGDGSLDVTEMCIRDRKKWRKLGLDEPVRIVITTAGCSDSFEAVVEAVKSKAGYDEAIVVSETSICRVRK